MKVSIASLKKFFGRDLSEADAVALRAVLASVDVSDPDSVDRALDTASRLVGGYGVEAIHGKYVDRYYQDIVGLYVNTGDTYNGTLLFNTITEKFSLTTMGDFVEKYSDRYQIG
jgi:hypothetical protein